MPLANWGRSGRLHASLWLKGPAACGLYGSLSWMTLRLEWLQCRAERETAVPYGLLWPCLPRASGVVGRTVATPRHVAVMWEWLWSWPAPRSRRPSWPASGSRPPRCHPVAIYSDSSPRSYEGPPSSNECAFAVSPSSKADSTSAGSGTPTVCRFSQKPDRSIPAVAGTEESVES